MTEAPKRIPISIRQAVLSRALECRGYRLAKRRRNFEYRIVDRALNVVLAPPDGLGWLTIGEAEGFLGAER